MTLTTTDLAEAVRAYYGYHPTTLSQDMSNRLARTNEEYEAYMGGREPTQELLDAFYAGSTRLPLHLLASGCNQLSCGWASWLAQQLGRHEPKTLLDYGCGLAALTGPLSDRYAVTLADLPGSHLGLLPQLYPAATVCTLDHVEGEFDAVVCTEVLEHVLDPEALLERLVAYCRPGGLLALSWSFGGHAANRLHVAGHEDLDDAGYFESVCRAAGLDCIANRGDGLKLWRKR